MQGGCYSASLPSVDDGIPSHWLHGFLDLALLSLLAAGRDYGYGLTQRLAAAGLGEVPGGTIYPALLRLERQGLAAATWESSASGPRRKYFELTAAGVTALAGLAEQWRGFSASITGLAESARDPLR
ncbi:PadR family transcriptional regulator, regulatory protein PadR [Jiangella alkaliphila]|uniref:PadR family transcriptional regulator, regulatory protein PadR n=1 Tax=Jiangella alkaliphila TaxID=419479 RepID=A0A1H2JJJ7_9ACTN|nr:PadR family transcriptional regulator, regulatory protein PadR [Jiangella alkaliphila]